ncbi:MAG TPA: GTP 3',8-cyclase MoaA [Gammaproteobacteria bacterium]|nr:GTP 3',8-cyclase MoaA [Gammaproteobacteria bacterium]
MSELRDEFNRHLMYLRLSITELCNFRCNYCLPEGCPISDKKFLTLNEISRLVLAFSELGVQKVRLTGGEPSLRSDLFELIRRLKQISAIKEIAYTTNGYRLARDVQHLYEAGVQKINVSVDSLSPSNFFNITGHNCLNKVLTGIEKAQNLNFEKIKINVVLLKGINDHEIADFIGWTKNNPINVRFIELMQTGENLTYFKKHHVSLSSLQQQLLDQGWNNIEKHIAAGPAVNFGHINHRGSIGLIMPYKPSFCASCNRLRVSSHGDLHLCLFSDIGYSLRHLLQDDTQKEELKSLILSLIGLKKESHFLNLNQTGNTKNLAVIGG